MAQRTVEQTQALERLHRHSLYGLAASPQVQANVTGIGAFLVESEQQLIALMNGTEPPAGGAIEFGMVLYWIHNDLPDDDFFKWLASLFPPTRITAAEIQQWETIWQGPGAVSDDGTLFGYGTFEQLDKGWLFSSILYLLSILTSELPRAPFGATPCQIPVGSGSTLRIAIIGDWGSGVWNDGGTQGPAAEIMQQIEQLDPQPDLVIHVGDVYYSGTGDLPLAVDIAMALIGAEVGVPYLPDEEELRLVVPWWKGGKSGNSFTLNSNHEMYSAARGYFNDALTAPVFGAQKNTSYFALTFQDWVILGLDSAYYSNAFAVMEGRLQDATDTQQVNWVQGLDLKGKKVIALTHHTGVTYDGQSLTGQPNLWTDMQEALGGKGPDYWYWGHVHNGIVYADSVLPGTKARCLGHAALPFGNAYFWQNGQKKNLDQSPLVDFYAHTPKPNPTKNPRWDNRVLNGFALLTLGNGTITEAYYEQGNPVPVWSAKA